MKTTTQNTLLSPPEAAEFLKRSPKTLANWRSQGIGPEYIDDGRIGYEQDTLIEWQNSHRVRSTAQGRLKRRQQATTAFQFDHDWACFRSQVYQALAVIQAAGATA